MPSRPLLSILCLVAPALAAQEPVRIFAAVSLTDVLEVVTSDFEAKHDVPVVPQIGGSSNLARQILAGAPADLFFSADRRQMDRLADAGLIAEQDRIDLLSNQLVVVQQRDAADGIDTPRDLLALERIAMADPEAVPAGVYARLYLESLSLWSALRPRVVPTLDVRAAMAAVASGNVEAGFVYRTDAAIENRVRVVYEVPRDEGPQIRYSLAILRGRERAAVRAFYDYLESPAAAGVFARFGFVRLEAER